MDIALRRLLRRLDDQLLEHLRAHCAEQAARIDELEAENERLARDAWDADQRAQMWMDMNHLLNEAEHPPGHVGITTDGSIVLLPAEPERARA
ncbi:hypothetical protein [Aquamicrobium sp.]|jgi:hypothetical protein|uniref:hypothetical protein n=1 Tax=Aquamicrobium sp. TaxID=1872579 RepID=UPI0025885907|nr:hypothetical protein [Aquamicrobium sp.]MCK9550280.1 hypothetical protein [Aquamicrobium sp.]